jgi:hypothetical protein
VFPGHGDWNKPKETVMKTFVPVIALLAVVEIFGSQELKMMLLGASAIVVLVWHAWRNV